MLGIRVVRALVFLKKAYSGFTVAFGLGVAVGFAVGTAVGLVDAVGTGVGVAFGSGTCGPQIIMEYPIATTWIQTFAMIASTMSKLF
jgi:hypothetical protein